MCLATPAEVVEVEGMQATVDVHGTRREVNVAFLDDVQVGDYVLLHAGFAIRKWTAEDVAAYEEIMKDL